MYQRSFDEPVGPLDRVCRHLRSKAIYVAGDLEPPEEFEVTGSGHCWCNMTQHVCGPDDQTVSRRECNSGRTCYEATL